MRILLPFYDDSTLIFVGCIGKILANRGHDIEYHLAEESENRLSDRQLRIHLRNESYSRSNNVRLYADSNRIDAVVSAKPLSSFKSALETASYKRRPGRPCYVVFHAGLELDPRRGFMNRANFDVVFLNSKQQLDQFKQLTRTQSGNYASYGHPYFIKPLHWREPSNTGDVVFFAQAISPKTLKSRLFLLRMMVAVAKHNPRRKVVIKLRHLPGENLNHVHKEVYSYPEIFDTHIAEKVDNLEFCSDSVSTSLLNADYAITCTSTAAMDAISRGIYTGVYLNYVQCYRDPLVGPMYEAFSDSNICMDTESVLSLRFKRPDGDWLNSWFRGDDLIEEMEAAIESFKASN